MAFIPGKYWLLIPVILGLYFQGGLGNPSQEIRENFKDVSLDFSGLNLREKTYWGEGRAIVFLRRGIDLSWGLLGGKKRGYSFRSIFFGPEVAVKLKKGL